MIIVEKHLFFIYNLSMDIIKNNKTKRKKHIISFFLLLIIICVLITFVVEMYLYKNNNGVLSKFNTSTDVIIEKILDINELSTSEYIYNGVVIIKNKDLPDKFKLEEKSTASNANLLNVILDRNKIEEDEDLVYVAYNGIAKMGIDISELKIDKNENLKLIVIKIPKIKVFDCLVDQSSLDYIYLKEELNVQDFFSVAYDMCQKDISEKVSNDKNFYNSAVQNTKDAIEALVDWLDGQDGYKIQVVYEEDSYE